MRARPSSVLDAELTDTAGTVVAVTQGTYQVRTIASIGKALVGQ